jgi:hypothetical protein
VIRVALALVAVLAVATPAGATDPVLGGDTAADIVASLAEATEAQGVCYGWRLYVEDNGGGAEWSGTYTGPGAGVDTQIDRATCPRWVVLDATLIYTSSTSELEDRASWSVVSGGIVGPTVADLDDLGLHAKDLAKDSKAEQTFANAVLALPVLTADRGGVAPIVLPTDASPAPADSRATDHPGSDRLRDHLALVIVLVVLIVVCLFWAAAAQWPTFRRGLRGVAAQMFD